MLVCMPLFLSAFGSRLPALGLFGCRMRPVLMRSCGAMLLFTGRTFWPIASFRVCSARPTCAFGQARRALLTGVIGLLACHVWYGRLCVNTFPSIFPSVGEGKLIPLPKATFPYHPKPGAGPVVEAKVKDNICEIVKTWTGVFSMQAEKIASCKEKEQYLNCVKWISTAYRTRRQQAHKDLWKWRFLQAFFNQACYPRQFPVNGETKEVSDYIMSKKRDFVIMIAPPQRQLFFLVKVDESIDVLVNDEMMKQQDWAMPFFRPND